jgi:hypothetical protein
MPCFCFQGKAFCYLWKDKKTEAPYILMVEGKKLNHPALESGNRARMKIFPVDPVADLPIKLIKEILFEGINLHEKNRND